MIRFTDFVPELKKKAMLFQPQIMEEMDSLLWRINQWVEEHNIEVINIETVSLPNIHHPHEKGSTDTLLSVSSARGDEWYQFIRVWHK